MPLKKKYYIILIILLLGILITLFSILVVLLKKNKESLNTQNLPLTQVNEEYRIAGKVEKIEGNMLLLRDITSFQVPPSIEKKETFTITITKDIKAEYPSPLSIPLIYKSNLQIPLKASINDVKEGQHINILLDKNSLKKSELEFKAVSILLPPVTNAVRGKIIEIKDNTVVVEGGGLPSSDTSTKRYLVALTKDTEISRYLPLTDPQKPPQKERLGIEDLKKDMLVTVYTNVDVEKSSKFIAYRIEPIPISNTSSSTEADPNSAIDVSKSIKITPSPTPPEPTPKPTTQSAAPPASQ